MRWTLGAYVSLSQRPWNNVAICKCGKKLKNAALLVLEIVKPSHGQTWTRQWIASMDTHDRDSHDHYYDQEQMATKGATNVVHH